MSGIDVLADGGVVTLPFMGWQSPETAPLDAWCIVWDGKYVREAVRSEDGWGCSTENEMKVLAWMPFPPPPALQSGAGE